LSKRVMLVFGTRPEATKMAPVYFALKEASEIEPVICVSAQHREMLDQVLAHFGMSPEYDLNIMTPRQSLNAITCRAIDGLDRVIEEARPDLVLVHGDTTTTMAASLAAFHKMIPVAHVEAGLRTHDKLAPYPEEMNRRIADAVSDLHFAPTSWSKQNLLREAIPERHIFVTGNTAVDALLWTVRECYEFQDEELAAFRWEEHPMTIAVEVHRRENWGEGMHQIGRALRRIAATSGVTMIVSLHKNPEVREVLPHYLDKLSNVMLHEPFSYPDWANLMKRSRLVITDSGGLQEEAPSLGLPVLVCRHKTERPEAVEAGTVKLVGTDEQAIFESAQELLYDGPEYSRMCSAKNPYGDGKAGLRTAEAIKYYFGLARRPPDFA